MQNHTPVVLHSSFPTRGKTGREPIDEEVPVATKEGDVRGIREGLTFKRYFTRDGVHPFDEIEWETRDAVIPNYKEGGNAF